MLDIPTALVALRLSLDALKGAASTLNKAEIEAKIADVQTKLIAVQNVALELQAKIASQRETEDSLRKNCSELERKLAKVENWERQASCYKMVQFQGDSQIFAMAFDPEKGKEVGIDDLQHYACAHCFQSRIKSILMQKTSSHRTFDCPTCEAKIEVKASAAASPVVIQRRTRTPWI